MKKFSFIFKTGIVLLSLILAINSAVFTVFATQLMGDIDGDGNVSSADAREVLRYSCRLCDLHEFQLSRADMNKDGTVNSADARLVLRRAVKLDEDLYEKPDEIYWTKTYLTVFYADECGGENYNTATVERIMVSGYGGAVPNYSKHADRNEFGMVTYYGYNVLGTTNRRVFPLKSVIEYKVGDNLFYGVILDNNGDNMAGRRYVTLDHLFCTRTEGNRFIDKYTTNNYLPVSDARIIGTMNVSTGKVTFY